MGQMSNRLVIRTENVMSYLTKICENADIFDELQTYIMNVDPLFEFGDAQLAKLFEEWYFDIAHRP